MLLQQHRCTATAARRWTGGPHRPAPSCATQHTSPLNNCKPWQRQYLHPPSSTPPEQTRSTAVDGRTAAAAPQDAEAAEGASAAGVSAVRKYRRPASWTPLQAAHFEEAVRQLGGPLAASTSAVLQLLPGEEGLTYAEVYRALQGWQKTQRQRDEAEAAGVSPPSQPRPFRPLTAEQRQHFEAAVHALGGLEWATGTRVWQRLPADVGLSLRQVQDHLATARRKSREQGSKPLQHGGGGGGGSGGGGGDGGGAGAGAGGGGSGGGSGLAASAGCGSGNACKEGACLSEGGDASRLSTAHRGVGGDGTGAGGHGGGTSLEFSPVHGWTAAQHQLFLSAVGAQGGPFAATAKQTLELLPADCRPSRPQLHRALLKWRGERGRAAQAAGVPVGQKCRTRVFWSPEVHARFEAAVLAQGGLAHATAKGTLERMGAGADLTPAQVQRHLSVCRHKLRSNAAVAEGAGRS